MADGKRVNPIIWTAAGVVAGALLGRNWASSDPLAFNLMTLILGTLAGLFVTVIVAAWPRVRTVPTEKCPRCGHPMPWSVVVCTECGEVR